MAWPTGGIVGDLLKVKFPVEASLMAVLMERKVVPKELVWRLKQVFHQSSSNIIRLPPAPPPPPATAHRN